MAFFSGELDWVDHYWSSRMADLAHFSPVMQTICPEILQRHMVDKHFCAERILQVL